MSGNEKVTNAVLLTVLGIVVFLMVSIMILFIRMDQLQEKVLSTLSSIQIGGFTQEVGIKIGDKAPEFSLISTDGTTKKLNDFLGRKVMLGFTSTHCPICKDMYPQIKAFSENNPSIQVVLLSLGSLEENRSVVQQQDFKFPVLALDENDPKVIQDYKVPGTPFFYVLDKDGVVLNIGFANTQEQLQELINISGK